MQEYEVTINLVFNKIQLYEVSTNLVCDKIQEYFVLNIMGEIKFNKILA